MRTVTRLAIDPQTIRAGDGFQVEDAAVDVIRGLLREARLIAPESNPLLSPEQILQAWRALEASGDHTDADLAWDPESRQIADVAREVVSSWAKERESPRAIGSDHLDSDLRDAENGIQVRALRHALSILAQMPGEEAAGSPLDLVAFVHDRDEDVFGLLFQSGMRFTVRLRHGNRDKLRAATATVVDALAPRPESEIDDLVRKLPSAVKVAGFMVAFEPIEMKTPTSELAQSGHVVTVTSQLGLLRHLALESPQQYLLVLAVVLLGLDLALETQMVGDFHLQVLSMRTWMAGNLARLGTGAFSAYLIAMFLKFAELSPRLRHSASASPSGRFRRRRAYGAFVNWRTD